MLLTNAFVYFLAFPVKSTDVLSQKTKVVKQISSCSGRKTGEIIIKSQRTVKNELRYSSSTSFHDNYQYEFSSESKSTTTSSTTKNSTRAHRTASRLQIEQPLNEIDTVFEDRISRSNEKIDPPLLASPPYPTKSSKAKAVVRWPSLPNQTSNDPLEDHSTSSTELTTTVHGP